MQKPAPVTHPVHPLVESRYSPRAFSAESIHEDELLSIFEAARWAPSCFNEQPWRFVAARREEAAFFEKLAGFLNESNRRWAAEAGALVVSLASTRFSRNQSDNRFALHDVGLATAQLLLQAVSLGIYGHVMAGFDLEAAASELALPEGVVPVAMIALGRLGDPGALPEDLEARELAPRTRRPLDELLFRDAKRSVQ